MRLTLLVALFLAGCGAHAAAPPAPAPAHAELATTIDALATDALAHQTAGGISIAVVWHGETIVAKGYGLADVEHRAAVDTDTVFRIASISKQFTAAAILRLAAAGKVDLDGLLTRYLPAYPTRGRAITLRHLLTHTSGIKDYERAPWLAAHMDEDRPVAELIASFAAEPFDFELGTEWSYSNSGYLLLGQIIEAVTGHGYGAELDAMVERVGVPGVRYCPDEQSYPHAARGYTLGTGGEPAPARAIRMAYAGGAGAMCATAPGLVAWARALSHGEVVDAAGWRAMTTPVTLAGGGHYDYGFGLFVGRLGDHRAIFHNGGINGFAAKLSYYPDDDLYVAVLSNVETGDADALDAAIGRAVLGVPTPPPPVDLEIDAAELAAVVGRYAIAAAGATIAIEADGGGLFAREDGGADRAPLARQADGSYVVGGADGGDPISIRFVREGDRVTGLTLTQAGMALSGKRLP